MAIDAGSVTALRTAAMVALATDLLAPTPAPVGDPRRGPTGPDRARPWPCSTVDRHRGLEPHPAPCRGGLATQLAADMPEVSVRVADRADDAAWGRPTSCAVPRLPTEPLFTASALGTEAHVNAIGSYRADMHEVPRDLLVRASVVAVDNAAACLIEAGEIVAAVRAGDLEAQGLDELSHLLARPPRRHGTTVFKSVGVALADLAVARLLVARL